MELTQDYRDLIENIIRKNPRFYGNEDLVEDFCSETFKRSYSIMSSLKDKTNIDLYINKIASSAILEVLRSAGRLTRTREGYKQRVEVSLSKNNSYQKDENGELLIDIEDPLVNIEEDLINEEEISLLRECVISLNNQFPEKLYSKIFTLRYFNEMSQAQIAEELSLSQGEVSKRLSELAKKTLSKLSNSV